jgi:predicted metal-binding membrane protein
MGGHTHAASGVVFWPLALMWFGMMAAMMAPTAWPWVHAFHRFSGAERGAAIGATARFASGYLLAWFTFAMGALMFLIAALYQFTPLKRACLTHCRTPLGYFLTRWVNGPMGGFRMGLHHGAFCVGCCWALMLTALAVGVMNAWWMAALGVLALIEQIAPQGQIARPVLGCAFLVVGTLLLAAEWLF